MKAELRQMTRKQLEKLRNNVDSALKALDAKDKKAALKAAEAAAKAHGFKLVELTGKATAEAAAPRTRRANKGGDGRAKVVPKFRNPNNPEQTWSGRGRAPGWMAAHLEAGGQKDDLAI
ncbi:MAG: DNA-binding protein [Rhodobacterales bacterium]|nr:MAG: DNA-binding protein [Rhodobacterales bacterium]